MTDLEITKVEHIWSKENDRWIFIQYDKDGAISGLNFMQGDEYNYFVEGWCIPNYALFEFYKYMLMTYEIERKSISALDFINKVMWTYVTAERIQEDLGGDLYNNYKKMWIDNK